MQTDEVRRLLDACPVHLRTEDGDVYLIERPEDVLLTGRFASIQYDSDEGCEHSMLAVERIAAIRPARPHDMT